MEKLRIAVPSLALVFLACAGNGGAGDAGSGAPDVSDGPAYVILVDTSGMEVPKADVPRCSCEKVLAPCPGDAAECVYCQASPAYCAECPVPFAESQTCTMLGLHCDYGGQTWCDCVIGDDGQLEWRCSACPC